jgi:hypothetical protein
VENFLGFSKAGIDFFLCKGKVRMTLNCGSHNNYRGVLQMPTLEFNTPKAEKPEVKAVEAVKPAAPATPKL